MVLTLQFYRVDAIVVMLCNFNYMLIAEYLVLIL